MKFNVRDLASKVAATSAVFAACSLSLAYVVSGGNVNLVPDTISYVGGVSILTLCASGPLAALLWIWRR